MITTPQRRENRLVERLARVGLRCAAVRINIQFNVHKAGDWKTTVLGGEGLVTRFIRPGRLWLQTRSQDDLVNWLIPRLPSSQNES